VPQIVQPAAHTKAAGQPLEAVRDAIGVRSLRCRVTMDPPVMPF